MKKIILLLFVCIFTLQSQVLFANFSIETNLSQERQELFKKQWDSVYRNLERQMLKMSEEKKIQNLEKLITTIDTWLKRKLPERNKFILSYLNYLLKNNLEGLKKSQLFDVVRVVDGDTIIVSKNWEEQTIRLIWIDTPETVNPKKSVECFWPESSAKARELLIWKKVRLESDISQENKDIYGRLLRYVYWEDGTFFNVYMIQNWYAFEYTYKKAYNYQDTFKALENEAKNKQLWFWNPETCNWSLEINKDNTEKDQEKTENEVSLWHSFYTSSHHSAKLYYCESDIQWKSLSEGYLRKFNSTEELLKVFPNRTLNEPCK